MNEAIARPALIRARPPPQSGRAARARLVRERRRQRERGRAPRRNADDPPLGQEGNFPAAWLVKAMTCIDLTTLAGDDTPEHVNRLCAKARLP